MNLNQFKIFSSFLIVGAMVLTTACKSETSLPGTDDTGGLSTPTPFPTPNQSTTGTVSTFLPSVDAEIYLKIERQIRDDTTGTRTPVGTCMINNHFGAENSPQTLTCTATTPGGDFSVPEGDLHFSTLFFTVGTNAPSRCRYILFRPYYYLGSVSAGFFIPWTQLVPKVGTDCTPLNATAQCWNGPAVSLVPGFPSNSYLFYDTINTSEFVSTLTSAYDNGQNSNRFVVNDNADWTSSYSDSSFSAQGQAVQYVGDTAADADYTPVFGTTPGVNSSPLGYGSAHQNYVAECRDGNYDVLSQVEVILSDENSVAPINLDDWHTWN